MNIDTMQLRDTITRKYQEDLLAIKRLEEWSGAPSVLGPTGHTGPAGLPDPGPFGYIACASTRTKPSSRQPQKGIHEEACLALQEPFGCAEIAKATGLGLKGAASQMYRWVRFGLLKKVEAGKYRRTAKFNGAPAVKPRAGNLDARPKVVPPYTPKSELESKASQEQAIKQLNEPFKIADIALATGLSKNGASSLLNRWCDRGILQKVGFGQYKRGSNFPGAAPRPVGKVAPTPPSPATGRIRIPGLDDGVADTVEELEAKLKSTIEERDSAKQGGRLALERILSDKILMLQNKIRDAR